MEGHAKKLNCSPYNDIANKDCLCYGSDPRLWFRIQGTFSVKAGTKAWA